MKKFSIVSKAALLLVTTFSCGGNDQLIPEPEVPDEPVSPSVIISNVDSASYNLGILLYNADQGKEFFTEFNSSIRYYWKEDARAAFERPYFRNNPYLLCHSDRGAGDFGVRMSLFKSLTDKKPLPTEISNRVKGIRFNALGFGNDRLFVQVKDIDGNLVVENEFELDTMVFNSYFIDFQNPNAKEIIFFASSTGAADSIKFGLDDVYFITEENTPFAPPETDAAFLSWLKRASFNFFDWNYVDVDGQRGTVLEYYADEDKVSLSGMGYAYAIYIIAAEEGFLSAVEAKRRIKSMMQWQMDQNWFDGSGGWHGFPHHYFRVDGSNYWPDVSTIDWAMCAAGIRVVKQYYSGDPEMIQMAETLLNRPDWTVALADNDKIAMGFHGNTGVMNDYRWALAFSEETELIYLEAVASGDLDAKIFDSIVREQQNGFYPSWFAAGFTYNWLQLWTGVIEPYKSNAIAAYEVDAQTSQSAFGVPLMGLTACSTVKDFSLAGFLNWSKYISNQGGNIHGAGLGQVIQISPAPYGAALALPFKPDRAITALRTFVDMGYYHEYLGLPDNVRINDLPDGFRQAPNWDPFDINIGPIILAIEQTEGNKIGQLYLQDLRIKEILPFLIESF
ncbi:MAG: hypothetical protein AAF789_04080 [Bacteroidota bacterium]